VSSDLRGRYFGAAHDILANEGYGALKLAELCDRVGVTTGAFYHVFASWQVFTSAFLEDWLRERTKLTAELTLRLSDPVDQMETLLEAALGLRHRSEGAIRVWSGVDPAVAKVQAAVDRGRYALVLEVMKHAVGGRIASRYARWGVNVLVGYEQATHPQTVKDLRWQFEKILQSALEERRSAPA
jgi:AcrR family transcriptional regulator